MPSLTRGLYELLVTEALAAQLSSVGATGHPDIIFLHTAEAADRISLHLASVISRVLDDAPDEDRVAIGIDLARRIVAQVTGESEMRVLSTESPALPGTVLRSIRGTRPDGSAEAIRSPLIPLLDTTLLTNAPGEPRVGHQIEAEIASADRIDLVMAFIRRTGINPLLGALRRHIEAGRSLRVLTTVFTGSTEAEAIELLQQLGADVRVSYDTSSTRLHAKAWLFHRESGFSTAYVGSSNLTHSAQVTGLEWNVRVSGARNRPVIEKITAVFESYWNQDDFESYVRERFIEVTRRWAPNTTITLSPIEIRLEPFQERLLEQIEVSREQGYHRNLLVAATGTGKTVMAAVDYARLTQRLSRARLLFVAHREEILDQSRATFAHALRDGSFGELWVGGRQPAAFEHVFASIQSLTANGLAALEPDHFDVVIIDEFHHAGAESYRRLLEVLRPVQLLGLTATPERSDGIPILHWFDDRIAAELRLWDAIDQHRLAPFTYFGIADDLDLREIPWTRGRGYDVEELTLAITATEIWARKVLQQCSLHLGRIDEVRALGFCVSVDHARYMAKVFTDHGVRATAVWADTPDVERKKALADLRAKRVNVVFSVDLFNEGVDVPSVDALLMLRPTDSPVLFMQQLGRGLRKTEGKTVCTVLDFVGLHRKEFRFDRRLQALLGGSRASVQKQVEDGFPFLPAGCDMQLDPVARERILESLRSAIPNNWAGKVRELRGLAAEHPRITLEEFLNLSGLDVDDIYKNGRCWSDLRDAARLSSGAHGVHEESIRKACGRLLHVDDSERLDAWRQWLSTGEAPSVAELSARQRRLLKMLLVQLLDRVIGDDTSLADGARILWSHSHVVTELRELFDVLAKRIAHVSLRLDVIEDVPLRAHARYTRLEILAAHESDHRVKVSTFREGIRYSEGVRADFMVFTLDKTSGQFSPSTRYRDYAISRQLIHWESQSGLRADTPTGRRYQQHASLGHQILLFARLSADDRAFHFLGPATYVEHRGEMPMAITWRLRFPLPGDLFQAFAAAVA